MHAPGHAEDMAQAYSLRGPRLMPGPAEALALAHSLRSCSSMSDPVKFDVSGLLQPRLLAQSYSCGICCLRPAPAQVIGSVLLLQSLLVIFFLFFEKCGYFLCLSEESA